MCCSTKSALWILTWHADRATDPPWLPNRIQKVASDREREFSEHQLHLISCLPKIIQNKPEAPLCDQCQHFLYTIASDFWIGWSTAAAARCVQPLTLCDSERQNWRQLSGSLPRRREENISKPSELQEIRTYCQSGKELAWRKNTVTSA